MEDKPKIHDVAKNLPKKRKNTCSDGICLEKRMMHYLMIRGINENVNFKIASNYDDAKFFDDVVYCEEKDNKKHFYLFQLKHKQSNGKINTKTLSKTKSKDYCLLTYFQSYLLNIKDKKDKNGENVWGDDQTLVLFIILGLDDDVTKNENVELIDKATFFNFKNGQLYKFRRGFLSEEDKNTWICNIFCHYAVEKGFSIDDVLKCITKEKNDVQTIFEFYKNKNKFQTKEVENSTIDLKMEDAEGIIDEFLSKFILAANQPCHDSFSQILRDEYDKYYEKNSINYERIAKYTESLTDQHNEWVEKCDVEKNINAEVGTNILTHQYYELIKKLQGHKYVFKNRETVKKIENHFGVYILKSNNAAMSVLKLLQNNINKNMNYENFILTDINSFNKVYNFFPEYYTRTKKIIVKCEKLNKNEQKEFMEKIEASYLHIISNEVTFVIVTDGLVDNSIKYESIEDKNNNVNDLDDDTIENILNKQMVRFQGKEIKLKEVYSKEMMNKTFFDGNILLKLLKGESFTIANEPTLLQKSEAAFTRINQITELKNVNEPNSSFKRTFLLDKWDDVQKVIDNFNQRDEMKYKFEIDYEYSVDEETHILKKKGDANNLKRFRDICLKDHKKNILIDFSGDPHYEYKAIQIYDPNFYENRMFTAKVYTFDFLKENINFNDLFYCIYNENEKNEIDNVMNEIKSKAKKNEYLKLKVITIQNIKESMTELYRISSIITKINWINIKNCMLIANCSRSGWIEEYKNEQDGNGKDKNEKDKIETDENEIDKNEKDKNEKDKDKINLSAEIEDFNEDRFIKDMIHYPFVVIENDPGMGKSTTLISLTEKMLTNNWVLRINFNQSHEAIGSLMSDNNKDLTSEEVVNFLLTAESGVSNKEKYKENLKPLLAYALENQLPSRKVLLMFDGFDELRDKHRKYVLKIFQYLQKNSFAKIWVTTRPHASQELRNEIQVCYSVNIKPFDISEQETLLVKLLMNYCLFSYDDAVKCYESLTDKNNVLRLFCNDLPERKLSISNDSSEDEPNNFNNPSKEESSILNNPLQLRLISEVCKRLNKKESKEKNNFDLNKINVMNMYQHFIEARYEIYYLEKIFININDEYLKKSTNKTLDKHHEKLAVSILFSKKIEEKYLHIGNINYFKEYIKSVGLIQSLEDNEDVYFIHKTFAEYFVASFLKKIFAKNKQDEKYEMALKFVITEIINPNDYTIQRFLDYMLAENCREITAILDQNIVGLHVELTNSKVKTNKDYLGRTGLHLAAQQNHHFVLQSILNIQDDTKKRDYLKKIPLHYAAQFGQIENVKYLLGFSTTIDSYDKLKEYINTRDFCHQTPLYYALQSESWNSALLLIFHGAKIDEVNLKHAEKMLDYIFRKNNYVNSNRKEVYCQIVSNLLNRFPSLTNELRKTLEYFFSPSNYYIWHLFANGHTDIIEKIFNSNYDDIIRGFYLFYHYSSQKTVINKSHNGDLSTLNDIKYAVKIIELGNTQFEKEYFDSLNVYLASEGFTESFEHMFEKSQERRRYTYSKAINFIESDEMNKLDTEDKKMIQEAFKAATDNNQLFFIKFLLEKFGKLLNENKYLIDEAITMKKFLIAKYLCQTNPYGYEKFIELAVAQELLDMTKYFVDLNSQLCNINTHELRVIADNCLKVYFRKHNFETINCDEYIKFIIQSNDTFECVDYILSQSKKMDNDGIEYAIYKIWKTLKEDHDSRFELFFVEKEKETNKLKFEKKKGYNNLQREISPKKHLYELCKLLNPPVNTSCNETILHNLVESIEYSEFLKKHKEKWSPHVSIEDSNGEMPIHRAARSNNKTILPILLESGSVFNSKNKNNDTPETITTDEQIKKLIKKLENLFGSVEKDNIQDFSKLMEDKQDYYYTARNAAKKTLFHLAKENTNLTFIKILTKEYQHLIINDPNLMRSLSQNDIFNDVSRYLLKNGAIFDKKMKADSQLDLKNLFVRMIMDNSQDCLKDKENIEIIVNARDTYGNTLLHYAVRNGNSEMVYELLKHGAVYNAMNIEKDKPIKFSWNYDVSNLLNLIDNLFNESNKDYLIPFENEYEKKKCDVIINVRNKKKQTLLHKMRSLYWVKFLLKNKADVEAVDIEGKTPLMCAAEDGLIGIVEELLKMKAKIRTSDYQGNNALHYAAKKDRLNVYIRLIKEFDKNKENDIKAMTNFFGKNPETLARENKRNQFIQKYLELKKTTSKMDQ